MTEPEVDLSGEQPQEGDISAPGLAHHRMRETTRTKLAYLIVGTVPVVVLTACLGFLLKLYTGRDTAEFAVAVLGPVGGIAGAVIGFYFGERAAERGEKR